jgi:cardiolipin synthase
VKQQRRISRRQLRDTRSLDELASLYAPGHAATLLLDGRETYPAMLEAIGAARRRVLLETYILRDDRTGRLFARALADRARAGCEVRVLLDAFGSLDLPHAYVSYLEEAGVSVQFYHSLRRHFWAYNRRDHRKLMVVDGEVGFLGGLNIADEYAPRDQGGRGWRDVHLRLQGPEVQTLSRLFEVTWRYLRAPHMGPSLPPPVTSGPLRATIIGNQRHGDRAVLRRAYLTAIRLAQHRIRITTPYLVPPRSLLRALKRAAARGVRVEIITAGLSDMRPVQLAGRALYPQLLKSGVSVYERLGRVLHAKTAVVDSRWCTVGSFNLNHRSIFWDLEVNAALDDRGLAAELEQAFERDRGRCLRITRDHIRSRQTFDRFLGWWLLRLRWWL